DRFTVGVTHLVVGGGNRSGAGADGMLVVVEYHQGQVEGVDEGLDRPAAGAAQRDRPAVHQHVDGEAHAARPVAVLVDVVMDDRKRPATLKVLAAKNLVDLAGRHLPSGSVGLPLYHAAELDLQAARQREAVVALEQEADP